MSVVDRAVEATAPTRVGLAGGALDVWPLPLFHRGSVAVGVAIDRRVWCRVAPRGSGVRIESKDALVRVEGAALDEVLAGERPPLAAWVLRALGLEEGVEVVTRSRVPAGSGLGESAALAVAVAAAAAAAAGRELAADDLWALARDAETQWSGRPAGVGEAATAVHGGALGVHLGPGRPRVERLPVDVAAVEECLLLASAGAVARLEPDGWELVKRQIDGDPVVRDGLAEIAATSRKMAEALAGGRLAEVPGLLSAEWEARERLSPGTAAPELERLATLARDCGGAARPCGGVVALWAAPGPRGPGPREALERALKAAGVPAFPFRADLQGLEVDFA